MGLFSRKPNPSAALTAPVGDFSGSPTQAAPAQRRGMFARYAPPESDEMSGAQRMQMFGAALSDAGAGFNGQQGVSVARMGQGLALQQEAALKRQEALQKSQQQAQMAAMADQLGLSPEEKMLFAVKPELFGELIKSRLTPHMTADGGIYGTQTADGWQQTGARGPTIAEIETGEEHDWRRNFDQTGQNYQRENQVGMLNVARQNAGTSAFSAKTGRLAYDARLRGVGGFGTPGVGAAEQDPNAIKWD
jgi:hypothetical protein